MTIVPLPISFDCEGNDLGYCQALAKTDLPHLQFPGYCDDELTGGLNKLDCENISVIPDLASVLVNLTGFNCSDVQLTPTGSPTHEAESDIDYVIVGKSYVVTVQLTNSTHGVYHIELGDGVGGTISNGVWSGIIATGAGTTLKVVGVESGGLIDGIISNISIQCIRYSQIYDIDSTDGLYEFAGPTKICKTGSANGVDITSALPLVDPDIDIEGKKYKISFKISGNTCNTPGTEIAYGISQSGSLGAIQVSNGFFEIIETAGNAASHLLQINLPSCFDGCIEDITVYAQNDIRIGAYTREKDVLADPSISIELVDGDYLASITDEDYTGCIRVGYADQCDDFYGQFTGSNIIDLAESRELINVQVGESPYFGYTFSVGDATYIIYRNFIVPGIVFDLTISAGFLTGIGTQLDITALLGGTLMTETSSNAPPYLADTPYTFTFTGTAGSDNNDLVIQIVSASIETDLGFVILDDTSGFIPSPIDLHVDQDSPQFIPQYFSECLDIMETVDDCVFIKIEWSNDKPIFGIDFQQTGFGNAQMYIQAKLWHPTYKKDREVYENAGGNRRINYSDTDETFTLTTGYIPEYLIKALVMAVDCDTFLINGIAYVCTSEEISPQWDKSFTLQTIELQFIKQNTRFVKSFC